MSNTLNDLYARKGQIVTTQEILQNQLNEVNKVINAELNKGAAPPREQTPAEKIREEKRKKKEEEKNKKAARFEKNHAAKNKRGQK